jgi:hypothetical protein
MKLAPNPPRAKHTDPRLVDVAQATLDALEHAVAVSKAPTSAAAFDLLGDLAAQQERRTLLQACRDADAATTKGHLAVKALLAQDAPIPASWLDRLVELEHARLDAVWTLGDWDAAHGRYAAEEMTSVDAAYRAVAGDDGGPMRTVRVPLAPLSALAVRLMTPATRRLGELDAPDGPEIREALAWLDACGPGWDSETTREAGRRLIAAAVRHGGAGRTGVAS